jgi:hypothetical protein
MAPEPLFTLANTIALGAWIVLAAWPGRRTAVNLAGVAVPAALAAGYTGIVAVQWVGSAGGFSTLEEVSLLFGNRWLLLAGWTHYLAFDLFVGAWEVRDARGRGIPHLLVLPCLALTFLFGPAGWLLYLLLRRVTPRRVRETGDSGDHQNSQDHDPRHRTSSRDRHQRDQVEADDNRQHRQQE